ncbi:hypothetical protein DV736_g2355, partial [Chaetothyriales sp. CBS 134916]
MPSPRFPALLHLYRHLLREASLLTLPQARTYFHRLIVSRFRHYANKYDEILNTRSAQAVQTWETGLHRRGRRLLSVLTRSNHGELRPFERVLQLTYGRKGPRRRYLMTRLMHPDSSVDGIVPFPSPRKMLAGNRRTSAAIKTQWHPPPLIRILLESQKQQQGHFTWSNYKIRPQGPALPQRTIWGKPMPWKRAKNAWAHWYAVHADRLYVPLSEDEYQAIKAMARGWVKVRQLPRRPRARMAVFASQESEGNADSLLLDPKRKNKHLRGGSASRSITERFVQRRMAQLLKHVPRLRQSDQPDQPPTFEWRDGIDTGRFRLHETTMEQNKLLFG